MQEASPKVTLAVEEAAALDEASDNAPTVPAPPYVPNALSLSSESDLPAARIYPMVSNVLPKPAAMQPGVAGKAPLPVLHVFTNQPWNPSDLALWGSKMPRLREDDEKCAQLFSNICTAQT